MNSKLKRWIRSEADVEFFCCVHAISMIFLYGLEIYLYGIKSVSFVIIFEMFLLSYVISWMQKLLFLREKIYSKLEFRVRAVSWSIGPIIITIIVGRVLRWYNGLPNWVEIVFIAIMLIYYLMIWIVLQMLCKDETDDLNQMLYEIKIINGKRKGDEDGNN